MNWPSASGVQGSPNQPSTSGNTGITESAWWLWRKEVLSKGLRTLWWKLPADLRLLLQDGSHGASKTKTCLGHYPQGHTSHCFACRKIDLICTTKLSCSPAGRNDKFLLVSSTPEGSSPRNDLQFALLNPGVHFEKWWVSAEQIAIPECQRYLPAGNVLEAVRLADCWVSGSSLWACGIKTG